MPTRLNKSTYKKLIEEDIVELNKYMPKESLERQHIEAVLIDSINLHYRSGGLSDEKTNLAGEQGPRHDAEKALFEIIGELQKEKCYHCYRRIAAHYSADDSTWYHHYRVGADSFEKIKCLANDIRTSVASSGGKASLK